MKHPIPPHQSVRVDIDPSTLDLDVTADDDDISDVLADVLGELAYALTTGQAQAALETAMVAIGALEPPTDVHIHIGISAHAERRAA